MTSQLPNGRIQFFHPLTSALLAGGTVDFYIPGTSTRKNTWQDRAQVTLNTNPVVLDSAGSAAIWGNGAYRQVVKDSLGTQLWDSETGLVINDLDTASAIAIGHLKANGNTAFQWGYSGAAYGAPGNLSFGAPGNWDNFIGTNGPILCPDFMYVANQNKVLSRGFVAAEAANPANMVFRRVNGTLSAPTACVALDQVGIIWAQPLHAPAGAIATLEFGLPASGGGSGQWGRIAEMKMFCTEDQTATNSGGSIGWAVTKNAQVVLHDAMWLTNTGKLAIVGAGFDTGNYQASTVLDLSATLQLYAPSDGSNVLAFIQFADPTLGFTWNVDNSTGQLHLNRMQASVETALMRFSRTSGVVYVDGALVTPAVAVSSLPSAATVGAGARHAVTDANATLTAGIGAVVAAGGANKVPVFSDGTNWRIG